MHFTTEKKNMSKNRSRSASPKIYLREVQVWKICARPSAAQQMAIDVFEYKSLLAKQKRITKAKTILDADLTQVDHDIRAVHHEVVENAERESDKIDTGPYNDIKNDPKKALRTISMCGCVMYQACEENGDCFDGPFSNHTIIRCKYHQGPLDSKN